MLLIEEGARTMRYSVESMEVTMNAHPLSESAQSDPRTKYEDDVSEQEKTDYPGSESEMTPRADHGEESYRGTGRLEGMNALITGGDSGIGRAVAIAFAREGANVAISFMEQEEEDAKETARWVREAGQKALLLAGDIQEEQHCEHLVRQTIERFGNIDILVNNAAFQMERKSISEVSTDEFERTFRTNVFAMFWLSKYALSTMHEGASIINTASIQAYDPSSSLLAYAPTKAAIVSFTKALAKGAAERGIRVNAVAPGPVWTPLIPSTMDEEHVKKFGKSTAFKRPAQPAELAPLYVLLASKDGQYLTGEVLGATGGRSPF